MSSSSLNSSQKQLYQQQPAEARSFVDRQLQRASAQVRLVDLLGGFLVWSSVTLAFLLTLAVIDAWILPLPVPVRAAALGLFVVGSIAYLIISLFPLLTRRINPMYAARMLEEGQPGLKNSLINFLSFRDSTGLEKKKVMEAVAHRAAVDLSKLPIDTTVDRGKLIRFGYLLVGLVAVCAAYMIFSPKNPLTTVSRIVAPLADVPPPARVRITDIQPGELEVTFGQAIEVEARVQGLASSETVQLIYSTTDGQLSEQATEMQLDESRGLYTAKLQTTPRGIEHELDYHVVAGDARSSHFRVTLQSSVTASVDSVEILPPAYTELPSKLNAGGDIEGVEGTEVVVRGRANFELQTAVLELFRSVERDNSGTDKPGQRIKMTVDGNEFVGRFKLELNEDRVTPRYQSYQLAVQTTDQRKNDRSSRYRINVFPDMAPEIEWVSPAELEVEMPVNGRLAIETRAIDRDFAIQRVMLRGDRNGKQILSEELLDSSRRPDDQHLGKFNLYPERLGLSPGDTVVFHAVAEDNRCHPRSGLPEANVERTENLTIRITGVDPRARNENSGSGGEGGAASGGSSDSGEDSGSNGGSAGDTSSGGAGETPESSNDPNEEPMGGGSAGEAEKPESGSETGDENTMNQGSGGSGTSDQNQTSSNEQTQGGAGSTSASGGSDEASTDANNGGAGTEESNDPSGSGGTTSSGGGNTATDPSGTGEATSETGAEGAGSGGTGESGTAEGNADAADSPTGDTAADSNPANSNTTDSDLGNANDQPHEGDVFEKILDHMKNSSEGSGSSQSPENSANESAENQGSGLTRDDQNQDDQTGTGGSDDSTNSNPSDPTEQGPESGGSDTTGDDSSTSPDKNSEPGSGTGQESSTGMNSGSNDPSNLNSGSGAADRDPSGTKTGDPQSASSDDSGSSAESGMGATSDPESGTGASPESGTNNESAPTSGDPNAGTDTGDPANANAEPASGADGDPATSTSPEGVGEDATGAEASGDESTGVESSSDTPSSDTSNNTSSDQGDSSLGNRKSDEPSAASDRSGTPGQSNSSGSNGNIEGTLPEGEEANLEYSRKATDLVLEYLKDQQDRPNSELLSDLDWTPEDLKRFLDQWETMKDAAAQGDSAAQERLTQRIRSLGLMPDRQGSRAVRTKQDSRGGLRQDGVRSTPPPEYAEKFKLFLRAASQAENAMPEE